MAAGQSLTPQSSALSTPLRHCLPQLLPRGHQFRTSGCDNAGDSPAPYSQVRYSSALLPEPRGPANHRTLVHLSTVTTPPHMSHASKQPVYTVHRSSYSNAIQIPATLIDYPNTLQTSSLIPQHHQHENCPLHLPLPSHGPPTPMPCYQ